jgi:hypothetical protein
MRSNDKNERMEKKRKENDKNERMEKKENDKKIRVSG